MFAVLIGSLVRSSAFGNIEHRHGKQSSRFAQLSFDTIHISKRTIARHCFDTAQARAYTTLARDLHEPDLSRVVHVAPTTQLTGELTDLDHAYGFTILLTEERGHTRIAGFIKRSLIARSGDRLHDVGVRKLFDLRDLFRSECFEMREVEAQAVGTNVATRLLHMRTEHLAQCRMQDVRAGVIARDRRAALRIDRSRNFFANRERARFDLHLMNGKTRFRGFCIEYTSNALAGEDDTRITHFATHFSIERRGGENDLALLPGARPLHHRR